MTNAKLVLASLSLCCIVFDESPTLTASRAEHTTTVFSPRVTPVNFTITNGCVYGLLGPQYGKHSVDRPADGYTVALLYLPLN